jgi:hypothetical protein
MMAKKPIFKTDFAEASGPADPEALFRNLRGRAPEIKHLWSQQADLLRAYHQQHVTSHDVAIELPTGAGKTLVGLLIAEWRRQARGERVAYLCPTRQLARQVGEQAKDYGIQAHVLIGKQRDYPPQEFSDYQASRAVAVTTYSGIFNVNPRIDDAHTLILDDAHAGENFMATMWSVELSRSGETDLYSALLSLLRDALDAGVYADLSDQSGWEPRKAGLIELIPGAFVRGRASAIRDLLNERLEEDTSPWYAWNAIKDHLQACNLFVSWDGILIRPLIPPTQVHAAFSRANQRVYMSATLGAGGELERLAGARSIERLPLPPGWDKRGSGRRLFLVPELAMAGADTLEVVTTAVQGLDRGLVLVPSQHDPEGALVVRALRESGMRFFQAQEIEDSIEPFVSSTKSVLVLSRYDGLDLPDETCRCVVIGGLPSGTNLQERFLWSRLSAYVLLRDRVLTRFTQGVGRCTRSDNDYALVLMVGRRLVDFLLKNENRRILNPELQAEMEFGFDNSREKEPDDFADLWKAFIAQDEEWKRAERAIVALRDRFTRVEDPVSRQLKSVVENEVNYQYARWGDDLESALQHARAVADALGGDETKAYRAWWYYLSADTSMALYEATGDESYQKSAQDLLRRASACCVGVTWLARLGRSVAPRESEPEANEMASAAVEAMRQMLIEWGPVGKRFEQEIARTAEDLRSTEYRAFHRGLRGLGAMLGFATQLPETDAAPDCVWSLGSVLYVAHEAKSDQTPEDPIGVNDVRQAASHENWIKANRPQEKSTKIVCLLETPRTTIAREAVAHAGSLCHVSPEQLREIFEATAAVLRRIRSRMADLSDEKVLEDLYREMDGEDLAPTKVLARLTRRSVSAMSVSGGSDSKGD